MLLRNHRFPNESGQWLQLCEFVDKGPARNARVAASGFTGWVLHALESSPVVLAVIHRQRWNGNWTALSRTTVFLKTHGNLQHGIVYRHFAVAGIILMVFWHNYFYSRHTISPSATHLLFCQPYTVYSTFFRGNLMSAGLGNGLWDCFWGHFGTDAEP